MWAGAVCPGDLALEAVSHRCTCKVQFTCIHLAWWDWLAWCTPYRGWGHSSLQSAGFGVHSL